MLFPVASKSVDRASFSTEHTLPLRRSVDVAADVASISFSRRKLADPGTRFLSRLLGVIRMFAVESNRVAVLILAVDLVDALESWCFGVRDNETVDEDFGVRASETVDEDSLTLLFETTTFFAD